MDFAFTEEQRHCKQEIIKFARQKLNHGIRQNDREEAFPWESWKACGQMGLLGLPVPQVYGGQGADILTSICTMEGLGYGCEDNGLVFAINSQMWSCEVPIFHCGTEAQKQKYLPALCRGELIGGHAMTEPDAGSDAFAIRTRAKKEAGYYILNGSKMFITNAPIADILIVFAVLDNTTNNLTGMCAFIVEKGMPGVEFGNNIAKMGIRTAPVGEVVLTDCKIPAENLLGTEGGGTNIFHAEMEWERSCLFACHIGVMERLVEECVRYGQSRRQFGQVIGKFQGVAHKIADMKVRIELGRLMLYKIGWLKMQGKKAPLEAAIAKLFISEAFVQTCVDAVQIHGAYGYMSESSTERMLRDAIASTIYSGTSEIQRNFIANFLGGFKA